MAEELKKVKEEMDPVEKNFRRRKDIIKNVAIIFLVVMLILTFFSNTIMNYSLPEVAVQYVSSGNITTKIRGTGTVESADPYNVMVKQTRKVASVSVRNGMKVEKGDLLFELDEAESAELDEALKNLQDAEDDYEKAMLQAEIYQSTISNSLAGLTINDYRNQIAALQKNLKAAEAAVDNANKKSVDISNQIAITGAQYVDDSAEKANYNNALSSFEAASLDYSTASANVSRLSDEVSLLSDIKAKLTGLDEELATAKRNFELAESQVSSASSYDANEKTNQIDAAKKEYSKRTKEYEDYVAEMQRNAELMGTSYDVTADNEATRLRISCEEGKAFLDRTEAWWAKIEADFCIYENAASDYATIADSIHQQMEYYNSLAGGDASKALINRTEEYNRAVAYMNDRERVMKDAENNVTAAKNALEQKTRDNDKSLTESALKLEATYAEIEQSDAKLARDRAKEKLDEKVADINAQLGLTRLYEAVERAQEKVDKLQSSGEAAQVLAPISGTILNVNVVSGKETNPDLACVEIQPEGQGYTCSFSVTNEQAKAISVGSPADLVNSWWYSDVQATVASIVPDKTSPNQKKLVTFNLTGDLTSGQSLSLSVGSKTANYDLIVPTSSIREDNNGKFILVVVSKPSPLGNRYIATRYDVEVLASDDTQSAISAGLSGYEYVITTSTKPINAGEQVRLANE